MPWSVIHSEGPLGEPVDAPRVAPPQPKLPDGTLWVFDGVPDDDVVPPDDVVVPPDEAVPVDVLPVEVVSVEVVPEEAVPALGDDVAADEVAASAEVAVEDCPPPHPAMTREAAAAAAVKVGRNVMAIAAWLAADPKWSYKKMSIGANGDSRADNRGGLVRWKTVGYDRHPGTVER